MDAFSGRTLDEKVVNPFLQEKRIPCSKGPYLSVFRRDARFDNSFSSRVGDRKCFEAFLTTIQDVKSLSKEKDLRNLLKYVLYQFIQLREDALIPLSRLKRISLEQYDRLLTGLLAVPSGGTFPVLLILSTFTTIIEHFNLNWRIYSQGINVADAVSGAVGDITVVSGSETILSAEITERRVDRSRVITTFNSKISPAGLEDYLFFVKDAEVDQAVLEQVRHYFSQGHEINFLEIKKWILAILATVGKKGRDIFNSTLLEHLDARDVQKSLKMAWNDQITKLTQSSS